MQIPHFGTGIAAQITNKECIQTTNKDTDEGQSNLWNKPTKWGKQDRLKQCQESRMFNSFIMEVYITMQWGPSTQTIHMPEHKNLQLTLQLISYGVN